MPVEKVRTSEERDLRLRSANRLFEFDALRGIAAFCVLWHHLRSALPGDPLHHKLLYPLFAGRQAVMLFFVLSGYVLSIPYISKRQLPYFKYLTRRVLRIYIPYVCALALAWVCASHFLYSRLPLTPWFFLTWQTPLTKTLLVQQLLMSTSPALNTAFWSLHYEMEISIIFPALMILLHRCSLRASLVLIVLCAGVGALWSRDVFYLSIFLLGAVLSREQPNLAVRLRSMLPWQRVMGLVFSLGLYYLPIPDAYAWGKTVQDIAAAIGSTGIILVALHAPFFSNFLRHGIFEYLGKISYSLYLVHGTVLFALLNLLLFRVHLALFTTLFIGGSLVVAHLFYTFVEAPGILLGKRLTS